MRRAHVGGAVILLLLMILGGSWTSILLSSNPAEHPLAHVLPWPVVCTTRGCITSRAWVRQQELVTAFVSAVNKPVPPPEEALTTLVRQHLVDKALLQEVVKLEDATKYRQEVLHLRDEVVTKQLSTLSLEDFDRSIVLPFLKQEALRQQLKLGPNENIFVYLSADRAVVVLPRNLVWNTDQGKIVK